jgi:hypothetical protein
VHPGVPAIVDPRLKDDLDTGRPQPRGRVLDVVDQESGDRAGGEVAVDRTVRAEDLDLAAVGELSIQNPGCFSSRRRPRTPRKKATVGSAFSVRVPTQASLLIRIPGPYSTPGSASAAQARVRVVGGMAGTEGRLSLFGGLVGGHGFG